MERQVFLDPSFFFGSSVALATIFLWLVLDHHSAIGDDLAAGVGVWQAF